MPPGASWGALLRTACCWAPAEYAYGMGITGLMEAAGVAGEMSRLAGVWPGELTERAGCARLALRWEAIGANGALFPALDADLTLTPAGDTTTLLALIALAARDSAGRWRPPGSLPASPGPKGIVPHAPNRNTGVH
jgi:hypothetical protein